METTQPQPYIPSSSAPTVINGTNGANGSDGKDGSTIVYGPSDPSPSDGKNGDTYINTTTNKIFVNKTNGSWPLGISLIGQQGTPGIQGIQGLTGNQGIPGVTGATGPAGAASALSSVGIIPPVGYSVTGSPLTTSGNMTLVTMPTTVSANVSSVVSSALETTLYSTNITASSMGTGGSIRFKFVGELSSTAINPNITVRIKLGSATLVVFSNVSIAVSLTSKPFVIEGTITNLNSASSQYAVSEVKQSGALTLADNIVGANWTVDTTQAQMFSITSQFGSVLSGTTLTPKTMSIFIR